MRIADVVVLLGREKAVSHTGDEGILMRDTCAGAVGLAMRCLGAGCLVSFVMLVVSRSNPYVFALGVDAYKPIVMGFFGGAALLGFPFFLFYAKDKYCYISERICMTYAAVGAAMAVVGVVGAFPSGLFALPSVRIFSVGWNVGGVLIGGGTVLLAIAYVARCSRLSLRVIFTCTAAAYMVSACLSALSIVAPAEVLWILIIMYAVGACACMALLCVVDSRFPGALAKRTCSEDQGGERCASQARFIRVAWKPLLGAFITAFVLGFTFDTSTINVPLNDGTLLALEKIVGVTLAAAMMLLLVFLFSHKSIEAVLLNIVLPVMPIVFILRPYFLDAQLDWVALAALGVVRETGFWVFIAAAWIVNEFHARRSQVAVGCAVGASFFGLGISGVAGLYSPYVLGPFLGYIGALLFIAYLLIIVVESSVFGSMRSNGERVEGVEMKEDDFEEFMKRRSAELAAEFGLTPREEEIASLMGYGYSYAHIAELLVVSESTVRTHARNMYKKTGASSRKDVLELLHGHG